MIRIIFLLLAIGVTVPVHADVSDSGNLTIGGTGVIQGTMTVQGNGFSVGGSTFSILAGTTQVGGLFRVSSLGIQWNDGSVSTTSSVNNTLIVSTYTFLTGNYETTETMGVCLPGSTITWTASGRLPAKLHFGGGTLQNYDFKLFGLNILVDGNYVDGYSKTILMVKGTRTDNTRIFFPMEINHVMTTILSAGTHTACVSSSGDTGPRGLDCSNGLGVSGYGNRCYFRVSETQE